MEQGFPPDAPWRSFPYGTILFHVVMLFLAITAVWGVVRSSRRPAMEADPWMWMLCAWIAGIFFIGAMSADANGSIAYESASFVFGYLAFVGFVCVLGTIISHLRMHRSQRGTHALAAFSLLAIGYLIFMSLPRVSMPREATRRSACRNILKQVGLALFKFEDANNALPRASAGDPPVSWRVTTLPFLEGQKLFEQYDQTLPWDDRKNELVAKLPFEAFMCPSRVGRQDLKERKFTDYIMLIGPGTVSPGDRDIQRHDITDGKANTALVVEATGLNVVWTEPRDFDTARQPIGINLKGKEPKESPGMMSSYHREGGHMVMGDGSVRFLNEKIDPRILRKLTTIDGGEKLDDE